MPDVTDGFEAFLAAQAKAKGQVAGPTAEQRKRVLESGEQAFKPNELSLVPAGIQQLEANMLAAVPRGVSDVATMAGIIPPAIRAGLSSDLDLPEAMMGKEGEEELSQYITNTAQKEFDALPEDVKNPSTLKNLQQTIANSPDAEDIRLKHSNPLINYGTQAGNAINSAFGLNRVSQESTTDDLEQLGANVLVPTSGATRAIGGAVRRYVGDSIAGRVAAKTAEFASDMTMPGTSDYTAKGIALNAGVQGGLNEGIRRAYDLPSITTGDAFLTAQDVTTGEPTGTVANVPPPDSDPNDGMGGWDLARDVAGVGGLTLGAVMSAGKLNKVAAKAALEDIDEINTNHSVPMESLSTGQKLKSEFLDESAAVGDTVYNLNPDKFYANKQNIDRLMHDGNSINVNSAYENFLDTGNLDYLPRKSIPINQFEATAKKAGPEATTLYKRGAIAKRLLDLHTLRARNLDDEIIDAQIKGDQPRLQATLKQKQAIADGTADIGDSMSVAEAKAASQALDSHPQASALYAMQRQIYNDGLEHDINSGFQTLKSVDKMKAASPNYMALQEDHAASRSWYENLWHSDIKGRGGWDRPTMFNAVRNAKTTDPTNATVKIALDPMEAMKNDMYQRLARTKRNDAIKGYVQLMQTEPDAHNLLKHVKTVSHDEFDSSDAEKMARKENYIAYRDSEGVHYYEVGDPEVARALSFDAPGSITALNAHRKIKQSWTTGIFRPIFATAAMKLEAHAIKTLRQSGRASGMFDAGLRRAFPDSQLLSSFLDKIGTNPLIDTFAMQQLGGIFMQISMPAIKQMGMGIADALSESTAIGSFMNSFPNGKNVLAGMGEAMVRTANESRYYAALHSNALNGSALSAPFDDVRAGLHGIDYLMSKTPLKSTFNMYKSLIDSMHNSGKYAFFAQNLASMERKYKGRANIPPEEMKKLVYETRVASGDMSKLVGNKFMQKLQSATPYSRIAVNATHALASAIVNDSDVRWRIVSSAIAPKVMMVGAITTVPAVADWYWNELPGWQRAGTIPVIGPDWWLDFAQGKQRELTPDDVYLVREDPGIAAISSSVVAGLRSLGVFGPEQQAHGNFKKEFREAISASVSVPLPPVLEAALQGVKVDVLAMLTGDPSLQTPYESMVQGMNTEGINSDSDFTKGWMNFFNSMVGVGAANLVGSIDVMGQSLEDGMDFTDSFKQAFAYGVLGGERAAAETPGTREIGASIFTGAQRRMYTGTEQRGRVTETFAKVEDIRKQLSMEKDTSGVGREVEQMGYQGIQRIQDPKVRAMAMEINKAFYSGKMKSLASDRASGTRKLAYLDAQKETISPSKFSMDYNSTVKDMHSIDASQEAFIDQFEDRLRQQYGIDLDGAIGVIEQSIGRQ